MLSKIKISLGFLLIWSVCLTVLSYGLASAVMEQRFNAQLQLQADTTQSKQISSTQNLLGLVNATRIENGLEPYQEDAKLNASALEKACDMVERDYFAHVDPNGREAWHLFEAQGYLFAYAGENLIEGFVTEREAMDALMDSPRHRQNILSEQYADIGIGRCGPYIVQHFGRLKYN